MVDETVRGGFPDPSFAALPGMERARALLRGQVPRFPLGHLTGIRPTQVGSGTATFTMPASPWLQLYDGRLDVHILAEIALEVAVLTTAPAASEVTTVTLSLSPLRPATTDSEVLVAKARVVNTGPTFTLAEVIVEDGVGRGVTHGTATLLISPMHAVPPAGDLPEVRAASYSTPDPYLRPYAGPFPLPDDLSCLSWIRAVMAGEYPPQPQQELLGIRFVEADAGSVSCSVSATEWLCGRTRHVPPGALAALASGAAAGALITLMPTGYRLGILEMTFNFFRAVPPTGHDLLARGTVLRQSDPMLLAEAEVIDRAGDSVVLSRHTGLFIPPRPAGRPATTSQRMLATVLFTDVVQSTKRAVELGDVRWQELLDQHHALVRRQLQLFNGREVKTTGDGFLATFDSPGRAVQCARATRDAVRRLGLDVRIGLHTGECEITGADVAGIAVHIAARIEGLAGPGEILASGTVRDLVTGSGLRFDDRGRHELKGIEEAWPIFAVVD